MTTQPSPPAGGPSRGRHRTSAGTGPNRTAIIAVVVVALVAAAGVVTWLVRSNSSDTATAGTAAAPSADGSATPSPASGGSGSERPTGSGSAFGGGTGATGTAGSSGDCAVPGGAFVIAAAPGLAGVLTDAIDEHALTAAGCPVRVESVDPAQVAADGSVDAQVWIPDSSIWLPRARAAGLTVTGDDPSRLATSPVVFALSGPASAQLAAAGPVDLADLLATRKTATPIRVGLPDPDLSAASVSTVLAEKSVVSGRPDARAALTWGVRSSPEDLPTGDGDLLARLAGDPGTAVPVAEQSLVAYNTANPNGPAHAVYPGDGSFALDYPIVVVGSDPQVADAAGELVPLLLSDDVRGTLQDAGFRAPDQTAGPTLPTTNGVDPGYRASADPPTTQAVDEAIRTVHVTNESSRMLAVMDISGSMLAEVPGADADRITLAKDAAERGLGLYRADSDIGLWEFSTNLTPTSDYRELIPISSLGPDGQGGTGAARLAAALSGLQAIERGGTGLYDTTLAAVRAVRAGYDPNRVNAVLLLTDGMNDDDNSITLDQLLTTLRSEQDPTRPIPVIAIAFGPDSDVASLQQISAATGGATYLSQDPRQIGEIFLDAVGQRLCRPSC